jgi:geranylgeranyl diphosphate synthase type I
MKEKTVDPEEAMKQIQKIFRKRGVKALQIATKEILSEKIESSEVREALTYFMQKYWRDTTRPALLSLICEAVGGKADVTTPIAVSAILTSGAVDIHDDIIDGSKIKEAGPTVFGKFGKDIALLAGDALLFKGLTVLFQAAERNISAEKLSVILDITKRTFFELGDAEALELRFRKRIDIAPTEYLHVLEKKAAIIEGYAQIGVILGDGSKEEFKDLGKYGKVLGMLIMLRDDLIDMIDVEEARHRIERESLPLPIVYALQNPKTKSEISSYLLKKKLARKDTEFIIQKTDKAGGIRRCHDLMQKLAKKAYVHLAKAKYNGRDLELLIRATVLL